MAAGLHLIKPKKGRARKAYRASLRGSSLIDLLPAQPLQITLSCTATTELANKQWEAAITIRALHLTLGTII